MLAATIESIEQTVTAIGFTPTPSVTPTRVPDATELKNLLSDTIKDELIGILGAQISVMNVSYGPGGATGFTELYVEMSCVSEDNSVCPSAQVITAVVDTCKEKKKKVLENVPKSTRLLSITIYDPGHATMIVEADWPDVLLYLDGEIPPDVFIELLRYQPY